LAYVQITGSAVEPEFAACQQGTDDEKPFEVLGVDASRRRGQQVLVDETGNSVGHLTECAKTSVARLLAEAR
jgi:hypothetical protein